MLTATLITLLTIFSVIVFIRQAQFGRTPKGARLAKIKASPNYRNGVFQNLNPTPDLTEGATMLSVAKEFIFHKKERNKPSKELPTVKTDLLQLDPKKDVMVWFGHSSYFIQLDGKKILVDPVLSGNASPVSFTTKAFKGTNDYNVNDIPDIDYLFITHDHWDHLDYRTVKQLQNRVRKVICGLGTGEHLERWGFTSEQLLEKDWNESFTLEDGFSVTTVPARHFSGRGFKRNKALWMSYVLQAPSLKLFLGGDSGYDTHFAEAGEKLGPFDLAILENGQYDKSWKHIHMMPQEVLKATQELKAKKLFPVHSSKFALANHDWDEPLKKITSLKQNTDLQLVTPRIGEITYLKQDQKFSKWWEFIN
ncbi:MBL fold metallo-hydrolase [Flavobacterium sp. SM15]|uniref:MBL fold metallo-hydrolase n=1 Tax=Flavobacterium sp. SM15 TaxID=2908005 RepID=UPI001EDAF111|nr:MBL fold metallo-hydrolase [Flavobacterium sp. SM15]MCG2610147.1 MBL fold metallo-hydrolase [Flavobacterium sp. SM15]